MGNIKVIRETLEDKSFRYALLCDGHVKGFKKSDKEYKSACVFVCEGATRIVGLIGDECDRTFEVDRIPFSITIPIEVLTESNQ